MLDESACTHNTKEKSGCAKPKAGATTGGCSFDGAQIALLPIADVADIVHGPIACAGYSWDNRAARSSGITLYKIGMTTDLSETDVVMGRGEKRLFHAIKQAIDSYVPKAIFIYNTCVTTLIGDDVGAVCKAATERWGTPVAPVDTAGFYGVQDVSKALRDFARMIGAPDLIARTEAIIVHEEAKAHAPLEPWRARLKDKRVLLYTGGVKSWSIVSALQDLGMKVVATGTKKSTEEDKARIRELMGEDTKMIDDGSPKALLSTYHEYKADILIAGGRNLYTALKARIPFLDINQKREFGYAGYAGMSELAHQLALSMESPVWAAVRKPAPWAKQSGPGSVLAA